MVSLSLSPDLWIHQRKQPILVIFVEWLILIPLMDLLDVFFELIKHRFLKLIVTKDTSLLPVFEFLYKWRVVDLKLAI